jgi:alcohol dehydrogenase class IV
MAESFICAASGAVAVRGELVLDGKLVAVYPALVPNPDMDVLSGKREETDAAKTDAILAPHGVSIIEVAKY